MKSPCFDTATHTDCTRRTSTCRLSCAEWEQYEAERNRGYAEQQKQQKSISDQIDYRKEGRRKSFLAKRRNRII